ncbi:MAG TPA: TonB-dependent receptor plug domain-containing protein, partial [Novosphingobium sp.]|nr:TonB-dependent receptor plug domain-containing protein [Novosphingobium sp.]
MSRKTPFKIAPFSSPQTMACCALAMAAALAAPAAHAEEADAAHAAAPAQGADRGGDAGGITVTARKTREKAQDVPIAITAIGNDQLARNNHIRLEELNQISPSTVVTITNGHQTTLSIRGLGANPGSDGLENSAGIFVDGVYLGRPGMASMDLIDIQQIEELRGPQGTLFGKNTTAGLLNITTALPEFTWGAKLAGTYGNYNYKQFQGSITGPISDTLAFRLTGYSTTRNGDMYDVANGQWVNNLNRNGARAQLLWKPGANLSVRLIGEYSAEQQSTGA